MPPLYGRGKPLVLPGFVTGRETPGQQNRRLRDINEALEKNREREEERKNRELFKRLERQSELRLPSSPPEPPPSPDVGTILPDDMPIGRNKPRVNKLGSQERYESLLDSQFEGYEATFGMTPLFGSQAYESLEGSAREVWKDEQSHIPDGRVAEREVGLFLRSRESRFETPRPAPDVDSKYDILIDGIVADVAAQPLAFKGAGGQTVKIASEAERLRYSKEAVDEWLIELEGEVKAALPGDPDAQTVREQMYRSLRIQEHLSDIFDEWGVTDEARLDIPPP